LRLSATDVLRRGLDNVLANWPVLLLRLAQTVLMAVIFLGFFLAAVAPIVVSLGININEWQTFDPTTFGDWLAAHWGVILWLLFLLSIVITLAMAIYAFFQAAAATIYVDGERTARAAGDPGRLAYRVFTFERWFAGGVRHWWRVFLVYNIAWFLGAMAILLPMLAVALLMMAAGPAGLVIGCITVPFLAILIIGGALLINAWTLKAVLATVRGDAGARAALRRSRMAISEDLGRTFAVMAILTAVLIGTSAFVSVFTSFPLHSPSALFALMPFQIIASLLQSVASAAVDSWFLATFAAME
jgi:hypothetical protein